MFFISASAYSLSDYKVWGNLYNGGIKSLSSYYLTNKYDSLIKSDPINLADNGKILIFTAKIKAKITNPKGWAELWIGLDNGKNETISLKGMKNSPIKGTSGFWQEYTLKLHVNNAAKRARYGVILHGNGIVEVQEGEIKYN